MLVRGNLIRIIMNFFLGRGSYMSDILVLAQRTDQANI